MRKHLVIVESPAKCKTIKKYLGPGFEVMASYGHIRDLEAKNGAVDPDHNFALRYSISDGRHEEQYKKIAAAVKGIDVLLLATDPDREGEAIAWHLFELLKENALLEGKQVLRVVFHEITKRAIQEAVAHPRAISMNLVNAQLARRALDHLIGFKLSPVLWSKIRIRNLSAGRVQSPTLRLIVERELEIKKFISREYWTIEAEVEACEQPFKARLTHFDNEKIAQFTVNNEKRALEIEQALTLAAQGELQVLSIDRKQRKRNPSAPFITSTLQQEASHKLGFGAQRTMIIAQQLYEGIELQGETVGLISYMRTDSVNLAQEAIAEIREVIRAKYGAKNVPDAPQTFKNKTKNAQEAHEAIRPTSAAREPAAVKEFLDKDQFRLYELIWKRTIACQMIHATIDTVSVDLKAGSPAHRFRANGSTIAEPGFMAVYQESFDESDPKAKEGDDENRGLLPPLEEGAVVQLHKINPLQHFTEPPPRYSEATLVKTMEEYGIGRPSTYAQILTKLQQRQYATLEKKRFYPSVVGRVVNKFLSDHFPKYVDYEFTAHMEDELNSISRGERDWLPVMVAFWDPLKQLIAEKTETLTVHDVTLDEVCPKCTKPLTVKSGEYGVFIGCTGYPDCNYTRSANQTEEQAQVQVLEDQKCPQCNSNLLIRNGPYGKFIGCSGYPECRYLKPLEEPQDMGVECPECKQGRILKRKSRKGKLFYSCSRYPDCKYALRHVPHKEPCPQCAWPLTSIRTSKRSGTQRVCEKCNFTEPHESAENAENLEAAD